MVARVVPVPAFDLIVFGATGDLSKRKLLPALYQRFRDGQLPEAARILGTGRSPMEDDGFRQLAEEAIQNHVAADHRDADSLRRFVSLLGYVPLSVDSDDDWRALSDRLAHGEDRPCVFYLSVGPDLFGPIARQLAAHGLNGSNVRIVVEKPLGHDLASARDLNSQLAEVFQEGQIYRIDHYLGKETVQNLMALRFANALFEPVWNARHVDHVQITVAESVGVAGRGGFYDATGATRDMVQNHLLQLLCLTAMEPPAHFDPDAVRDEKVKVLRSLTPPSGSDDIVRGQYRGNERLESYGEDVGDPASRTESFVAIKAAVANWRWSGTPFYLRTGKRLRARMSEIAVFFKDAPHSIFPHSAGEPLPNVLAIRLQPDEGITLSMTIKDPGPGGMRLTGANLDMTFADGLGQPDLRMPDAYERLVMDVVRGDQTLFMRSDEVEAAWAWIDPLITDWAERRDRPTPYDIASSGPEDALMLMHRDGRRWREIAI
ncbi:glucose-6-phosphate dehydrogenase [Rhodovibrio salinarum]|uniref:Glucose-6-phosphate 1-dehydrogenase n=1 Tax=Rhodovibrio salinarum TaxID=1087 RepID=A0A934QI57_9PROT|nr:glucose-6-phosphate dehydrogenase [Rhodovibrio salinarum]MBK1697207.1 glucose-6-phosphate dehydrogenase [Rhodovibrio salinarum]